MSSGVILLQRPYISFSSDSKVGDNCCGSGLVVAMFVVHKLVVVMYENKCQA